MAFLSVPLTQEPINTLEEVAKSGIPTASLFGSSYILGRKSANPWILQMADDHVAFYDSDAGLANYSRGELVLYQSRQFLENEIRAKLTDQ